MAKKVKKTDLPQLPDIPITTARLENLAGILASTCRDDIYSEVGKQELSKMGVKKRELCMIAGMFSIGFKVATRAIELGATIECERVLGDDQWLTFACSGEEPNLQGEEDEQT